MEVVAVIVIVALGVCAVLAGLIVAAAVSDFRVAAAAYRELAQQGSNNSAPWWYVGGGVKLTLLAGVVSCVLGAALLLADGLAAPARVAGAAVLPVGTLLLIVGELTRHRLVRTRTSR